MHQAWNNAHMPVSDMAILSGHLTGTPLGDPIEVGAVTGLLQASGSGQWQSCGLQALKSIAGHAEPAAGLSSLATVCHDLSQHQAKGILHLREVNPHLTGLLAHETVSEIPLVSALRQPSAQGQPAEAVSSFAYQGSNAHCVLRRQQGITNTGSGFASAGSVWKMERCWILGFSGHPYIKSVSAVSRTSVRMQAPVMTPSMADIFDCGPVVPLSCWLETLWGAVDMMGGSSSRPVLKDTTVANGSRLMSGSGFLSAEVSTTTGALTAQWVSPTPPVPSLSQMGPSVWAHCSSMASMMGSFCASRINVPSAAMHLLPGRARHSCDAAILWAVQTAPTHAPESGSRLIPQNLETSFQACSLLAPAAMTPSGQSLRYPSSLGALFSNDQQGTHQATAQGTCAGNPETDASTTAILNGSGAWTRLDCIALSEIQSDTPDLDRAAAQQPWSVHGEEEEFIASSTTPFILNYDEVKSLLMDEVASVLGFRVDASESLIAAGLDSIAAVELRNKLQGVAGRQLPAVVVFDNPSVEALATYLTSLDAPANLQTSAVGIAGLIDFPQQQKSAVSVLAVSNVQPCQAAFESQDLIEPVSFSRWDPSWQAGPGGLNSGGFHSTAGGWLCQSVSDFDSAVYGINTSEAAVMDPQQRLLLEQTHKVLSDSGCLGATDIGTYVGIGGNSDFSSLCVQHCIPATSYTATGIIPSVASGRLSFLFGLQGPSVSVDTACSSSLVACHQAAETVRSHRSRGAVSAGVMLALVPASSYLLHLGGILSEEGRCKVLDTSTDGYVRGEDAAALLLWNTGEAQGSSQPLCALLLASAVNNDGASSSLTAPYGPAQKSLLQSALQSGSLDPDRLRGCHLSCNGSNLGDVIEVNAVSETFLQHNGAHPDGAFVLMSIKSTTGHQEAASGAAVASAVSSILGGEKIPPMLHLRSLNPHVAQALLDQPGPSRIGRTSSTPWSKSSRGLACGINSFGMQGTNSHVTLAACEGRPDGNKKALQVFQKDRSWPLPVFVGLACTVVNPSHSVPYLRIGWRITPDMALLQLGCEKFGTSTLPSGTLLQAVSDGLSMLQPAHVGHQTIQDLTILPSAPCFNSAEFESVFDLRNGRFTLGEITSSGLHLSATSRTVFSSTVSPAAAGRRRQAHSLTAAVLLGPKKASAAPTVAEVQRPHQVHREDNSLMVAGEIEASFQICSVATAQQMSGSMQSLTGSPLAILRGASMVQLQQLGSGSSTSRMPTSMAWLPGTSEISSSRISLEGMHLDPCNPVEPWVDRAISSLQIVAEERSAEHQRGIAAPPLVQAIIAAGTDEDRHAFLQSMVGDAVEGILGAAVGQEDNLYAAGMDSRAGMITPGQMTCVWQINILFAIRRCESASGA